jgi:hypothetical protein
VKQAVVARDGNDGYKAFSALGKKKEDMMWGSIMKNDCDSFWSVASAIVCPGMKSVTLSYQHLLIANFAHLSFQVVIRVVQSSTCTLRQASAPLVDAATGSPLTLAAALQILFQFSLPGDVQVSSSLLYKILTSI